MSKRQFKSQASSSRAVSGGFGGFSTTTSTLSYLSEPADLSQISDSNIVVAFKNLLKKDSITKSKALEDLLTYVQAHPHEEGGVEQAILDSWVKQYPRISIDNSRRVRELSHKLQYELLHSGRKRMERHIPNTVGVWLAGTFDKDRPVSRAACDGLTSFLDSEEKILMLWKKCQAQILGYASEAIKETPQTLSDERAVNTDEMQSKYDRVIGSSLSLILNLLSKLSKDDISKNQREYETFLTGNPSPWKFIAGDDAFVRRTASELLSIVLEKYADLIEQDLEAVSSAIITDGMKAGQSGSVVAYLKALIVLTSKFPTVWTTAYKSKRSSISRLRHFIEKGSHGGPAEFWRLWGGLLKRLPDNVLPIDESGIKEFLQAQRTGISRRDEISTNSAAAWESYVTAINTLISKCGDITVADHVISSEIYPLFEQSMRLSIGVTALPIGNSNTALAQAFLLALQKGSKDALTAEWERVAGLLVEDMLVSLPEKSKDHAKSQNAVIAEGHRWFVLQAEILKLDSTEAVKSLLANTAGIIIDKVTDTLESRNGKPFGAAGILLEALKHTPSLITSRDATTDEIVSFFEEDLPKLIVSPSSAHLIASLNILQTLPNQQKNYESIWQATIDGLLATSESTQKRLAIKALIASRHAVDLARVDDGLQAYLLSVSSRALDGEDDAYGVLENAIIFSSFSSTTVESLVNSLIESMDNVDAVNSSLRVLELVVQRMPESLKSTSTHLSLMTKLLSLAEVTDEASVERINNLRTAIERSSQGGSVPTSIIQIVQNALGSATPASLSIDTLVAQAITALSSDANVQVADLYPDPQSWVDTIAPLLSYMPNPALALSNPLKGAVFLIDPVSTIPSSRPERDAAGYSIPLRMALYTAALVKESDSFSKLELKLQVELLRLLCLVTEVANDQLETQESNLLWTNLENLFVASQVQDFISNTRNILISLLKSDSAWRHDTSTVSVVSALIHDLLERSQGSTTLSFYLARALSSILANAVELNGWQTAGGEEWLTSLKVLSSSTPDVMKATAVLLGLSESLESSKLVGTLCNRLVSDISGATTKTQRKTASTLVYFNAIMAVYETGDLPIAKNRLVLAVRQITSWMGEESVISAPLGAEALKALSYLLPCVADVYGSHWNLSLDFATRSLVEPAEDERVESRLPLYNASIRHVVLCRRLLDTVAADEKNDDIEEALKDCFTKFSQNMVELLRLPRVKENHPWTIVDDLLCRELKTVPVSVIKDAEDLFYLLASDTRSIQLAVFDLLQRYTLANAENVNYESVLEKQDAKLPQELISLLLDSPVAATYDEETLAEFPATIRSYLFTWLLLFSHYIDASYKVRLDYNIILKDGNYTEPLLDFISEALGHTLNEALNLEAARITPARIQAYDLNIASSESPEHDLQWLLVHLFYQCLTYVPSLTKTWWMDNKSKQTRLSVESWTEKYISPLILDSTLDEVQQWSEKQETAADDDKELIVKVSRRAREIYAGYEVDDMTAQLVIRLPSIYPLSPVSVDSVNRVAVSEKKWQSWLMITKGVIVFSNGSITDGLATFRKNISASLKGQTECAICYSIVSSDRKMPDKRCGTCKNLFHSDCLFKWFASSNQSTCPLCRNPFTYGDVRRRERA